MDSICIRYFWNGSCPNASCPHAHRFTDLHNSAHWVLFHAPDLQMLDFLPYRLQSHHYFQAFPLRGTGPAVRFATPEDALTVVNDFKDYYNPQHLPAVLAKSSNVQSAGVALAALSHPESGLLTRRTAEECPSAEGGRGSMELAGAASVSSDDLSSEDPSGDSGPPSPSHTRPVAPASPSRRSAVVQRREQPGGIVAVLREQAALGTPAVGWIALERLWGLTPKSLDEAVLQYLARKLPSEQEQILLSFAAIDLTSIQNLSAYLNCLIKEHATTPQVCVHFLAGLCSHGEGCQYTHPVGTAGWALLSTRWGVTYQDFDFAVLNYLSKKPVAQQDEILSLFAEMNLRAVKNRSAYLSSMIERYERVGLRKRSRARGPKASPTHEDAATCA